MYDKIITNAGNGFDITTGDFVVPQDGTYMIHYNSLSELGMVCLSLFLYNSDDNKICASRRRQEIFFILFCFIQNG